MTNFKCIDCFFSVFDDDENKLGQCFRYPPQVFLLQSQNAIGQVVPVQHMVYPLLKTDNQACGEFSGFCG